LGRVKFGDGCSSKPLVKNENLKTTPASFFSPPLKKIKARTGKKKKLLRASFTSAAKTTNKSTKIKIKKKNLR
jgi:hypothetical protein